MKLRELTTVSRAERLLSDGAIEPCTALLVNSFPMS